MVIVFWCLLIWYFIYQEIWWNKSIQTHPIPENTNIDSREHIEIPIWLNSVVENTHIYSREHIEISFWSDFELWSVNDYWKSLWAKEMILFWPKRMRQVAADYEYRLYIKEQWDIDDLLTYIYGIWESVIEKPQQQMIWEHSVVIWKEAWQCSPLRMEVIGDVYNYRLESPWCYSFEDEYNDFIYVIKNMKLK